MERVTVHYSGDRHANIPLDAEVVFRQGSALLFISKVLGLAVLGIARQDVDGRWTSIEMFYVSEVDPGLIDMLRLTF